MLLKIFANKYSLAETVVRIYSLDLDCFSWAISFAILEKIRIVTKYVNAVEISFINSLVSSLLI